MSRTALLTLALFTLSAEAAQAASPSGFNLQVPAKGSGLPVPPQPPSSGPPSAFQPAPTPNRDLEIAAPRASDATTVAPSLFTRPDQYRGDGFNKGSTSQSEQEKRLKPGAGFSLHMPFTGY